MAEEKASAAIHLDALLNAIFTQQGEQQREAKEILKSFGELMSYYRCAMKEVSTKFEVLNEEFSLRFDRNPISSIHSRLKKGVSIYEKMQRNKLPITLETIEESLNDIAGVRVVCTFVDDVYRLEKALLEQDDVRLIARKDYIKNPKANGYRSLHLIIAVPIFLSREKRIMKVEVQLRTIAMDSWASLEHQLRYKKDYDFTEDTEAILRHCAELSSELDYKMNSLCRSLISEDADS